MRGKRADASQTELAIFFLPIPSCVRSADETEMAGVVLGPGWEGGRTEQGNAERQGTWDPWIHRTTKDTVAT